MHRSIEFTETLALFLTFAVWSVFGALLVGPVLTGGISVGPIAYAVLSLTLIRMIPGAISWTGLGLRPRTVLFAGSSDLAGSRPSSSRCSRSKPCTTRASRPTRSCRWRRGRSCSRSSRTASRPRRSHEATDVGSRRRRARSPNSRTLPSRASDDAASRIAREGHPRSAMVGEGGVEPPRPFGHRNLNLRRRPCRPTTHGLRVLLSSIIRLMLSTPRQVSQPPQAAQTNPNT